MDEIDALLRYSLMRWGETDMSDPLKNTVVSHMSQENWVTFLYSEPKLPDSQEEHSEKEHDKPWVRQLMNHLFIRTRKTFASQFPDMKWTGHFKENTQTFRFGPMGRDELLFRFELTYQDHVIQWKVSRNNNSDASKKFMGFSRVIEDVVRKQGYDLLIVKKAKANGRASYTGGKSKHLYHLLAEMKTAGYQYGSCARGHLYLQENKKKRYVFKAVLDEKPRFLIINRETNEEVSSLTKTEDVKGLSDWISKTERPPRQKLR